MPHPHRHACMDPYLGDLVTSFSYGQIPYAGMESLAYSAHSTSLTAI